MTDSKTVFVLTTLFLNEIGRVSRSRTPGIYETLEDAKEAVTENHGDIAELGYYNHAVIEEMPFGLYPEAKSEVWLKIEIESNGDFKQAIEVAKPEALKGTVSFGIG